jgi:hypothetical protein
MSPKLAITALTLALLAIPSVARSYDLITPEEDARDRAAPHVPGPSDLPAPPVIELVRPDISKPVQNPVTIEVRFGSGSGPAIDMQTFRASYGWLGINITSRLLEHATKRPDSLVAENVDLPPGDHRVTISIANTSGKTASRTFRLPGRLPVAPLARPGATHSQIGVLCAALLRCLAWHSNFRILRKAVPCGPARRYLYQRPVELTQV